MSGTRQTCSVCGQQNVMHYGGVPHAQHKWSERHQDAMRHQRHQDALRQQRHQRGPADEEAMQHQAPTSSAAAELRDLTPDIVAERVRQVAKGRTAQRDDERSREDWGACFATVLARARFGTDAEWRAAMVKLIAIGVSATSSYDRQLAGLTAAKVLTKNERCTTFEPNPSFAPACMNCGSCRDAHTGADSRADAPEAP